MTDTTTPSAIREVIFNDGTNTVRFPLAGTDGGVPFSDLARFQPKILFGDPSKDDNDLLSSWQISDLSGGNGIIDGKEGTDAGRFADGTFYTRFPSQITPPPYAVFNSTFGKDGGAGDKYVLGELWDSASNDVFLVYARGLAIRRGLMDQGQLDGAYVSPSMGITTLPVNKGVAFQGTAAAELFFIPQGNAGYATITGVSIVATEYASPKFRAFSVWDNKLVGVTTGGRMYWTSDGTTWTAYDLTYQLSKSYAIRDIVSFFDRRDEPCLFVLTGRDMWQFDPDGPELFRVDFGWPSHPHHADAAAVWQGQLFIALGMGVFRYTSGTWMPVGLDRDNGLAMEHQGYIMDLIAGYNSLYAIVQGVDQGSVYGGKSAIYEFSGSGWHCIWEQDLIVNAAPSSTEYHGLTGQVPIPMGWGTVTRSGGEYTLAFGTGGTDEQVYTMGLSTSFANPRSMMSADMWFDTPKYVYLETMEFDADMEAYIKIGNAFQFYLEEPDPELIDALVYTIKILMRVDRGDWTVIGSRLARAGRYTIPLGDLISVSKPAPGHPSTQLHTGVAFERIQFRVELHRPGSGAYGNGNKQPIITNMVFNFLKTVSSNDSFTITVDCSKGSGDYSPQELMDYIDNLTSVKKFGVMTIGEYSYRVFVAQNGGTRYGGDSQIGMRSLSIVEISPSL